MNKNLPWNNKITNNDNYLHVRESSWYVADMRVTLRSLATAKACVYGHNRDRDAFVDARPNTQYSK